MVWNRRKKHWTAKTINETQPDRLHWKWDLQNWLCNFSSSNIKNVTVLAYLTVWDWQNGIGRPTTTKTFIETWPDQLCLKQDFQNCLSNFPSFNIKKVTDFASLTVWKGSKLRGTTKNGNTVNETQPDRLRLKQDFQNSLWNFSTSSIKEVMNP